MRIPMKEAATLTINDLDKIYRLHGVEAVLDITDMVLLKKGLGLDDSEIKILRGIWKKLSNRRLLRKR